MINRKTLIVVGAGASREIGLPLGSELREEISTKLDLRFENGFRQISGDDLIIDALREFAKQQGERDINPFLHTSWMIRDALPQSISIDNFIDAHRDDFNVQLCGKLAIAKSILEAERNSDLFVGNPNSSIDFKSIESSWYSPFFKILTENASKADLNQIFEKTSFITFNYDRCIEQFIHKAINNYYRIPEQECASICRSLEILHPYGNTGFLPWQNKENPVGFGEIPYGSDLLRISGNIKTFTEQITDDPVVSLLQKSVEHADTIIFLGFAFHRQNMNILKPKNKSNVKRILGTATGISNPDVKSIEIDILEWLGKKQGEVDIQIRNDLKCHSLFYEYWRTLSN